MIKVLAIDPAFRNVGWCIADVDPSGGVVLRVTQIGLIETKDHVGKKIRKSSDDFRRAKEIATELRYRAEGVDMIFTEIPGGSQSSRAAWCLGISLGILTNLTPLEIVEITPSMTKKITGTPGATKDQMIEWAVNLYPSLPWIRMKRKAPEPGRILGKNEHIADAIGVLHAGAASISDR